MSNITVAEVGDFLRLNPRDCKYDEIRSYIDIAIRVADNYFKPKCIDIRIPAIRQGILILVGHWFNAGEPAEEYRLLNQPVPFGTGALWNPHIL